jgi:hypothetical protein
LTKRILSLLCCSSGLQPLRDYLTGKLAHTVHIADVVPTVTFSALEPAVKKQKLDDGETLLLHWLTAVCCCTAAALVPAAKKQKLNDGEGLCTAAALLYT